MVGHRMCVNNCLGFVLTPVVNLEEGVNVTVTRLAFFNLLSRDPRALMNPRMLILYNLRGPSSKRSRNTQT